MTTMPLSVLGGGGLIGGFNFPTYMYPSPPPPPSGECGGGSRGNGVCSNGQCCSQWGWCGVTPYHCNGPPPPPVHVPPTSAPTTEPTSAPTLATALPTALPTSAPIASPTSAPTKATTALPTSTPIAKPTSAPIDNSVDACDCEPGRFCWNNQCICESCTIKGGSCGYHSYCGPESGWNINSPYYRPLPPPVAPPVPTKAPTDAPTSAPIDTSVDACDCEPGRFCWNNQCICESCTIKGGSCGYHSYCGPESGWNINSPYYRPPTPPVAPPVPPPPVPTKAPTDAPTDDFVPVPCPLPGYKRTLPDQLCVPEDLKIEHRCGSNSLFNSDTGMCECLYGFGGASCQRLCNDSSNIYDDKTQGCLDDGYCSETLFESQVVFRCNTASSQCPGGCEANEVCVNDGNCVCKHGYGRLSSGGPCVTTCHKNVYGAGGCGKYSSGCLQSIYGAVCTPVSYPSGPPPYNCDGLCKMGERCVSWAGGRKADGYFCVSL